ncbi:hypothetical protein [Bremerella alba]|uniref:Uncharacterized protein n=1 Tax=Bremerella alba TaxID=980252 RepID=A0A7V9A7X7_9BACT|nr:hypothetical protein [Bremerella alba]MBA2115832.1 hypothetical protein [Bremerella alba]
MSSTPQQPDQSGAFSNESPPQLIVRAGKTFVCSACGVMVEVPAKAVGRMMVVHDQSSPKEVVNEEPAPPLKPITARPPRPKRPPQPSQVSRGRRRIDGLIVPAAGEMERALAWVSFHLKLLDRQGTEFTRLRKLLKQRSPQQVPSPSPQSKAKKRPVPKRVARVKHARRIYAHEVVSMPLENASPQHASPAKERGPP